MKIKILKDCTVDRLVPFNGNESVYNFSLYKSEEIDCVDIVPVSKQFSNILLDTEDVLVDLRNDLFVEVVCPDQDPS